MGMTNWAFGCCFKAAPASAYNEGTGKSGIPNAYAIAFAVELPTLRPVYDPGPELTDTAAKSPGLMDLDFNSSLIAGANRAVWFIPSVRSRNPKTSFP